MMKQEQQKSRSEKMSNYFEGNNFTRLTNYKQLKTFGSNLSRFYISKIIILLILFSFFISTFAEDIYQPDITGIKKAGITLQKGNEYQDSIRFQSSGKAKSCMHYDHLPSDILNKMSGKEVYLSAELKSTDIGTKPKSWNGVKLLLSMKYTDGNGKTVQAAVPTGSSDGWVRYQVKIDLRNHILKSAILAIGVENVSGTAEFRNICIQTTPEKEIICGDWNLIYDSNTGEWNSLSYQGEKLFSPADFEFKRQQSTGKMRLTKALFKATKKELVMYFSAQNWTLSDTINFDALGIPGMLRRSYEFCFVPNNPDADPVKFEKIDVNYSFPSSYSYWIPGTELGDTRGFWLKKDNLPPSKWLKDPTNVTGRFMDVQKKEINPEYLCQILLLSTNNNTSIVVMQDSRRERSDVKCCISGKTVTMTQRIRVEGWALPNQPQKNISSVFLRVMPKTNMKQAMAETIPLWYKALNWLPPADRPDWIKGAGIYVLYSNFLGRKGLQHVTSLIPRAQQLGFDVFHLLPVYDNLYNPSDFYSIGQKVGTPEDLRGGCTKKVKRSPRGKHVASYSRISPHKPGIAFYVLFGARNFLTNLSLEISFFPYLRILRFNRICELKKVVPLRRVHKFFMLTRRLFRDGSRAAFRRGMKFPGPRRPYSGDTA